MTPSTSLTSSVAAALRDLRSSVRGTVLVGSDPGYDDARRLWNGAVDRHPALIVRCADDRDVVRAVLAARERGLPLSVRGGGHDWAGRAVRDGGVVLDLTGMREVTVDPHAGTAHVGGGARSGDVAAAAAVHGMVPVTGTVNVVGLVGLTLAGGYGLLNGRFGLALDNLLSARVVLADGLQVTASPAEHPELFWALRGGGGNFGVVTSARYRVHPVDTVLSGMLLFPLAEAPAVLRGYRELIAEAPDELTVMAGFFGGPDGQPLLFLLPLWSGTPQQGEPLLSRLERLGKPVSAQLGPMAYRDVLGQFDQAVVDGRHNEVRTRWLPRLAEDSVAAIVAAAAQWTSPYSMVMLHHFHGAAARVPVPDTAFALRREHLMVEILASWVPTGASADTCHRRWARTLGDNLAGRALPGGYPNLLDVDEYERARQAYGPNAERLLAAKRHFDPDDVFRAVPSLTPPR